MAESGSLGNYYFYGSVSTSTANETFITKFLVSGDIDYTTVTSYAPSSFGFTVSAAENYLFAFLDEGTSGVVV